MRAWAAAASLLPTAAAASAVVFAPARFTALSPSLLRLELAAAGSAPVFDDRHTLSMPARPGADVKIAYNRSAAGGAFAPGSLRISLLRTTPVTVDAGNLQGTRLGLGCYDTFE
eukprot:gene20117-65693_t